MSLRLRRPLEFKYRLSRRPDVGVSINYRLVTAADVSMPNQRFVGQPSTNYLPSCQRRLAFNWRCRRVNTNVNLCHRFADVVMFTGQIAHVWLYITNFLCILCMYISCSCLFQESVHITTRSFISKQTTTRAEEENEPSASSGAVVMRSARDVGQFEW